MSEPDGLDLPPPQHLAIVGTVDADKSLEAATRRRALATGPITNLGVLPFNCIGVADLVGVLVPARGAAMPFGDVEIPPFAKRRVGSTFKKAVKSVASVPLALQEEIVANDAWHWSLVVVALKK